VASAPPLPALQQPGIHMDQISVVYKFGGSSVATAERMREVAAIVCAFPDQAPLVVLSAMGKTTNLLLQAGEEALNTDPERIAELAPLRAISELHHATANDIGVDPSTREELHRLLNNLQQLLVGISIMQDLTARARDSLVSFGERLSTRLFAALLNSQGVHAVQHDAWDLGVTTSDNFGNADVDYAATLPAVRAALQQAPGAAPCVPIVTGFLGRGRNTGAITTLGRGGSDLTATLIGAALEVPEVQVWKDVDGVLTSDPRMVSLAAPIPLLTFDEATELAYFGAAVLHPSAMQPALQSGALCVRVKNSYNRLAPGTLISSSRDMSDALVTCIVLKPHVTVMDIVSTKMLGQFGFLSTTFGIFQRHEVSVDVVATSEVSVSLTLDPSRIWSRDLIDDELDSLVSSFTDIAKVSYQRRMAIISIICNVERTSEILERAFRVLKEQKVNVKMMSQGASKTNISLIVADEEAERAVKGLHRDFFE